MKQKVRTILVLIGWVVTNHTTVKFKNIWFDITNMSCEVERRRWNWLGHVLRRGGENDCVTALDWRPKGRRARGRPRMTWRRTVEKEGDKAGWISCIMARMVAQKEWVGQTD